MRRAAVALGLAVVMLLPGCTALSDGVGYYAQSIGGHLRMLQAARPLDELLSDPATDPALAARLRLAREIRAYAWQQLALPDNDSYTRYADLKRPFVVWNVFATPELSMKLEQWCFPVVGCVTYRGYYDRAAADAYAQRLRERGLETHVGGVPAYSTLGWTSDPLLNTFIRYPDGELARLIFHELAHQVVYAQNDSTFNESFATAVEEAGVERWLADRADPRAREQYAAWSARRRDFVALLSRHRALLEKAYADDADEATKRARKAEILGGLRAEYERIKAERWGGFAGYDRWFAQPLTNAHLAAVGTYTEWVPAFRALLSRQDGDLPRFYAAVRRLAKLSKVEREAALDALAPRAARAADAADRRP